MSLSDELSKLAALRASGTLSEEEFTRAKERLLNAQPANAQQQTQAEERLAASVNSLRRSRTDRWFGGVCGGIGRASGVESWVWRLLFAVLFLCFGAGLLVYVLLWLFVPSD